MAETVVERLTGAWARTDRIFEILAPEAFLAQPIALRHPFIFYVGHLPAFAWNHICAGVLGLPSLNAGFDELFSRGIDPDVDDPTHCHAHPDVPDRWPSLAAVLGYRERVRAAVLESVDAVAERAGTHLMARDERVFTMIIEHELMHQETLLYMMQQLPYDQKVCPAWLPPKQLGRGRPPATVRVPAGTATLGCELGDLPFGWDNEFPSAQVLVPGFHVDETPVTNGQFLAFVDDGGYRRPELWNEDDREWLRVEQRSGPPVWTKKDGRWIYRGFFELLPLVSVADWPVYVSLAEARAYARWQGKRLLSEPEFHRAAYGDPSGAERAFPWGGAGPGETHGNFDSRRWSATPVGAYPEGASAWGVHELIGNGWEWTDTPFAGFQGFEAWIPEYPGYSADFFDGKHFVLKGASWATGAELVRRSFRNWYQAHYPYVFAKFRCVWPD
ncbi:MAG TPA: SUMF1/EgtB/PvdO family nonheme iron enzyme [Methylomirabilota bacterium]|jgi:ergothioneine biosynthesis protein EgtB|nr:SUMF1/EgtB/PvdO family nonheme iron enzyme [Methylomirabilota bacterium]